MTSHDFISESASWLKSITACDYTHCDYSGVIATMPRKKTDLSELGAIDAHGTEFRVNIKIRDLEGKQNHIYGPSRISQEEALKDLEQIRKASFLAATREEGIKLMEAEAIRIKKLTEYQSEILQTIERMASRDIVDDSDCTDNDDMSDHSIPDWMKEYPSEDNSPGEAIHGNIHRINTDIH